MNDLSESETNAGRHLLDGSIRVFLAEALYLPTGLLVTIFLTRWLRPEGFGIFVLAMATITWIEVALTAFLSRSAIRLLSHTADWRRAASTLLNLHLVLGLTGGLVLVILASPLSEWLKEPSLAGILYLFSLDIPLFALAQVHRLVLIGRGQFRQRALAGSVRWVMRGVLIILFVAGGLSVKGAVLGTILATIAELLLYRRFIRPTFDLSKGIFLPELWKYSVPLFFSSMSVMAFERLDLFMLKFLGATTEQAGIYGAAQNLMVVRRMFAISLAPLLLSSLTRLITAGSLLPARNLASEATRFVFILFPLFAAVAASAPEAILLVFGTPFAEAGDFAAPLVLAAHASLLLAINGAILTAAGLPGRVLIYTSALVPLACLGHLVAIPRFGPIGAACVTGTMTYAAAVFSSIVLQRAWEFVLPLRTFAISLLVGVAVLVCGSLWSVSPFFSPVKLFMLVLGGTAGMWYLGEIKQEWVYLLRQLLLEKRTAPGKP
jgi:O-antigen/teichoic acid export membrane protein